MIGQRFSGLIVLAEGEAVRYRGGKPRRRMICQCDCGTEKLVEVNKLRAGHTRSCGCLRRTRRCEEGDFTRKMRTIVDGFLGWTTEFLNFIPVGDTYALVDEEDFPALSRMSWYLLRVPGSDRFYAYSEIRNGKKGSMFQVRMHRLILSPPKGFEVDHGNRNGLDNRRENLRPATRSQNSANRKKSAKNKHHSKYKGVTKVRSKWHARIHKNGEHYYLGRFPTERDAGLAYNKAAKELFGEFALTNQISSLAVEVNPTDRRE